MKTCQQKLDYMREYLLRPGVKEKIKARRQNPVSKLKARQRIFKFHHGVDLDYKLDLFTAQEFKCAACGATETRSKKDWCLDHDHATGKHRGVLCPGCNFALGHAKDDPRVLRSLADYLEQWK